jgi:hypothetical protein
VRVEQGYRVCVLRRGGGGVDVLESILRFRLRAVLGEQEGFKVLVGFVRGLEKESWGTLAFIVQSIARLRPRHLLGRFSSSIVTFHVL